MPPASFTGQRPRGFGKHPTTPFLRLQGSWCQLSCWVDVTSVLFNFARDLCLPPLSGCGPQGWRERKRLEQAPAPAAGVLAGGGAFREGRGGTALRTGRRQAALRTVTPWAWRDTLQPTSVPAGQLASQVESERSEQASRRGRAP